MTTIITISEAQQLVRDFAKSNNWVDEPNIDKFDHLHEELIEMSSHLRYKTTGEMQAYITEHKDVFEDGIGDLFFATCRLANQLGVDIEKSFNLVSKSIVARYADKKEAAKQK